MNPFNEYLLSESRRQFLGRGVNAVGWAALASLLGNSTAGGSEQPAGSGQPLRTHFPPKAKQVIYLHMVGGPPQMDLYDYKPKMNDYYDKDLPESIRNGQRLTTMTSGQARFPIAPSKYKFAKYGKTSETHIPLSPCFANLYFDGAIGNLFCPEVIVVRR